MGYVKNTVFKGASVRIKKLDVSAGHSQSRTAKEGHPGERAVKPRALVTGASEGIGREIARQLATEGYALTLVARSEKRLKGLRGELPGDKHRLVLADLSLEKDVSKLSKILGQGSHHLLVNNAGSGVYAAFADAKEENLVGMMRLNMEAPLRLAHAFLSGAKAGDKILNIGSVLSYTPLPGNSVYAASKSFLASWSEALWHEAKKKGIWVGVYCPGYTKTLFSQRALAKGTGERPEGHPPPWLRLEPQVVARKALRFMNKARNPVGTPGPFNKLLLLIPRLLSRRALVKVMGRGWK